MRIHGLSAVVLLSTAIACSGSDGGSSHDHDAANNNDVDGSTLETDGNSNDKGFALVVTDSPPGPQNGDPASWQGVVQFSLEENGAELVAASGIPKEDLADPVGLVYRAASKEVFVANRHGNNSADGVAGSISRFIYDEETRTFTANGEITGGTLSGVHQLAFSPTSGELFAANVNNGISRYTFNDAGVATANGLLGSGPMRGVIVSPDGTRVFATTAGNDIRVFDLSNDTELTAVAVEAGANLHYLRIRDGEVYVAGLDTDKIYRLTLDGDNNLAVKDFTAADSPSSLEFSPDGLEMFACGHRDSDVIHRFDYDAGNDTWVAKESVDATTSLGDILVLP